MDRSPTVVPQIQFRECRLVAAGKGRPGTAFSFQSGQCEFDMLAGTQFVGRIVRTGTEVVAGPRPADCHTITGFRLWITDTKLREKRLRSEILQAENLLAPELAAQGALPISGGHVIRGVSTRKLRGFSRLGNIALAFHNFRVVIG